MAYHVVRLALECEQILETGDLDLERDREQLKSIRRGEWKFSQVEEFFERYERRLSDLYASSTLPHTPREDEIKDLLLRCLEHHYGSLNEAVRRQVPVEAIVDDLRKIVERYG